MSKSRFALISAGLLIIVLGSILQGPHCCAATYYKYVDKNGTVCLTDSEQSIPEEYRKQATVIKDDAGNADKKLKRGQAEGDGADGSSAGPRGIKEVATLIWHSRFFKPGVVMAVFLCLFIAAGKIGRMLGHKRISFVLRIVLTAGVLVYLIHIYGKAAVDAINLLK